jgi:hypothetical protein
MNDTAKRWLFLATLMRFGMPREGVVWPPPKSPFPIGSIVTLKSYKWHPPGGVYVKGAANYGPGGVFSRGPHTDWLFAGESPLGWGATVLFTLDDIEL